MQKCSMALQIHHWSWLWRETSSISTWLTLSSHRIGNIEQVVWSDGRNLHVGANFIYLSIYLSQYSHSTQSLYFAAALTWRHLSCRKWSSKMSGNIDVAPVSSYVTSTLQVLSVWLSDSGVNFTRDSMRPHLRRYTGRRASYQVMSAHQCCSHGVADVTQPTSFKGSGLGFLEPFLNLGSNLLHIDQR